MAVYTSQKNSVSNCKKTFFMEWALEFITMKRRNELNKLPHISPKNVTTNKLISAKLEKIQTTNKLIRRGLLRTSSLLPWFGRRGVFCPFFMLIRP